MLVFVRKMLGLCVHEWERWQKATSTHYRVATNSESIRGIQKVEVVTVFQMRVCEKCGLEQIKIIERYNG